MRLSQVPRWLQRFAQHLPSPHLRLAQPYLCRYSQQRCQKNACRVRESNRANLKLPFLSRPLDVGRCVPRVRIWGLVVYAIIDVNTRET